MIRQTYELINLKNIEYNVSEIVKNSHEYKYHIGVVKANCYGLGIRCVKSIIAGGANFLAVSSLEEALKIRKFTDIGILVLEPINIKYIDLATNNNISITISSLEYFDKIKTQKFKAHIKVNTGMNRLGINNRLEFNKVFELLKSFNNYVEGIYTHIYNASNTIDTDKQFELFEEITKDIDLKQIDIVHIPNSETIFNYLKKDYVNGCRMGIIMYGFTDKIKLKSTFSLVSNIIEIKYIKKDETVGYNGAYRAIKDSVIGIVPIGYADGFIRKNTGNFVYINNNKYRIVGNICMDMLFVLIDDTVKINSKVYIIKDNSHIDEIANNLDTINYEIMCMIGSRVKRIYTI